MAGRVKRVIFSFMILCALTAGYGCASASVGFGYHVPVTNRIGTGVYFGVGF